jgi:hypothetical protein
MLPRTLHGIPGELANQLQNMKLTGFETRTASTLIAAVAGVLGILGASCHHAAANDIAYSETIYNTDFASAGVGGMRNASTATLRMSGIVGTVNQAYLYWHGPMNSANPLANATIQLNGQAITGELVGLSDDNCWGFNTSVGYRADVTPMVQQVRNGSYVLSQFVKQGTNVNANGASLLVFFNDGDPDNNRDVVLFEGNDSNAPNIYDGLGWNVSFGGIDYSSGQAIIQLHVSDGQTWEDDALILNGSIIQHRGGVFEGNTVPASNNGPENNGRLWDIRAWDITAFFAPGTNNLTLTHGYIARSDGSAKGDCVSLIVAAINLPAGSAPEPGNRPPVITGTSVITVNHPNAIPVQALVTDEDGNALTYTITVDNQPVQTGNIPGATPVTSGTLTITSALGLGQHTVVFSANDGQATGTFTTVVNVIDNTPPVLTIPDNITVPTDPGKTNAVVTYVVTATDDFPDVQVFSLPASGTAFPIGTTTVTATAVDSSGNTTKATFTITVTDSLPPAIHCPADIFRSTDLGASNAVVHYTCPASDNMPNVTVSCTPKSGSVFPIGITTVVCTAKDAVGNTATCMFTVTIVDTEPPVITTPTNQIVVADLGQCSAVVNYTVAVSDNVPGVTLTCTPPSGTAFAKGATPVVCIAADTSNNRATNSFTVTVQDKEKPILNLPANIIVSAAPGAGTAVVTYSVTAMDNCSVPTVVSRPDSGSAFPLGTTIVTAQATDGSGNIQVGTFTITVVDTQPPVITVPTNLIVAASFGQCSAVVSYTVTLRDNAPGATLVCTPPSGSVFPKGTTTVNCIATDAAANASSASFTVTVVDLQKPVLSLPANITVLIASNETSAVVNYNPTATDNCSTATVVSTPPSGSTFPIGVTTVTTTATDGDGNVTTGSFTVTVKQDTGGDNEPPVIISITPSKRILWPPNHKMIPITVTVKATDDSGDKVISRIISVTSSEPENGLGDGDTGPDWKITGPLKLQLRAERSGSGNDRIYTITIECKDEAGNITYGTTTVTAPHDMRKKK